MEFTADEEHDLSFSFKSKEKAQEFIIKYKDYTADGKAILPGDTFYLYDDVRYNCYTAKHGEYLSKKYNGKRYKFRENVIREIELNKPQYSVVDMVKIVNNWGMIDVDEMDILNFIKNDK